MFSDWLSDFFLQALFRFRRHEGTRLLEEGLELKFVFLFTTSWSLVTEGVDSWFMYKKKCFSVYDGGFSQSSSSSFFKKNVHPSTKWTVATRVGYLSHLNCYQYLQFNTFIFSKIIHFTHNTSCLGHCLTVCLMLTSVPVRILQY